MPPKGSYQTTSDVIPGLAYGKEFRAYIGNFLAAVVEGLDAQHRYERNIALGLTPASAAKKAFNDTYAAH